MKRNRLINNEFQLLWYIKMELCEFAEAFVDAGRPEGSLALGTWWMKDIWTQTEISCVYSDFRLWEPHHASINLNATRHTSYPPDIFKSLTSIFWLSVSSIVHVCLHWNVLQAVIEKGAWKAALTTAESPSFAPAFAASKPKIGNPHLNSLHFLTPPPQIIQRERIKACIQGDEWLNLDSNGTKWCNWGWQKHCDGEVVALRLLPCCSEVSGWFTGLIAWLTLRILTLTLGNHTVRFNTFPDVLCIDWTQSVFFWSMMMHLLWMHQTPLCPAKGLH